MPKSYYEIGNKLLSLLHLLLKKKNHCEPVRIPIWKLHVLCKKVSAFQNKYKIENRSGGRPSKTHF